MNYNLSGTWAGNQISAEWVQPMRDDVNGYQLERHGALYFTWQYMFCEDERQSPRLLHRK